jgi:hypothetical protein
MRGRVIRSTRLVRDEAVDFESPQLVSFTLPLTSLGPKGMLGYVVKVMRRVEKIEKALSRRIALAYK